MTHEEVFYILIALWMLFAFVWQQPQHQPAVSLSVLDEQVKTYVAQHETLHPTLTKILEKQLRVAKRINTT